MAQVGTKLFYVSRPVSWPNTAYPFAAGYLVSGGSFGWLFVVGTLFFLIPYNLLMYGINDVFDYESDMQNPRKGSIEGAREQKAFHPTIICASALLPVPFLAYLFAVGSVPANMTLVVLLFFVVAYSVKYLRFKEMPLLDSITSSIHFVGPLLYALVLTGSLAVGAPFIAAFFLWGMASHALGAVQDIVPDRKGGIHSIATALGAQKTMYFVLLSYIAAIFIMGMQGMAATVISVVGLLYVANILPFLRITDAGSARVNVAWRRFIWLNLFVGFVVTVVLLTAI